MGKLLEIFLAGTLSTVLGEFQSLQVAICFGSGHVRDDGLSILNDLAEVGRARLDLLEDIKGTGGSSLDIGNTVRDTHDPLWFEGQLAVGLGSDDILLDGLGVLEELGEVWLTRLKLLEDVLNGGDDSGDIVEALLEATDVITVSELAVSRGLFDIGHNGLNIREGL